MISKSGIYSQYFCQVKWIYFLQMNYNILGSINDNNLLKGILCIPNLLGNGF